MPRAFVRGGFHMNTLGSEPGGHAPTYSVGGSYAALTSLWIDAQATLGSEAGEPRLGRRRTRRVLANVISLPHFPFDKKCHSCRIEIPPEQLVP